MTGRVRQRKHYQASIASSMPLLTDTAEHENDGDTVSSLSVNDDPRPLSGPVTTAQPAYPRSPYLHPTHQATASTSTFNAHHTSMSNIALSPSQTPTATAPGTPRISASRKPSSLRHVSHVPTESSQSTKRRQSPGREGNKSVRNSREQRIRVTPRLPHAHDVPIAPATTMYWSRAPVHGTLPMHSMRAHTVTLVDNVAWLFGGCDDKGCWKDIYCFDTGGPQISYPGPPRV